jgi:hypothetical protein
MIGTWNVRTLNQGGKLENLKREMQKNAVSALGVSEVRWKRQGDYTVYHSGLLTREDGTDTLSRNVGKQLPHYAV